MTWSDKWQKELQTGQYYDLLQKGFFDKRPEELEPDIGGLDFYFDAFRELSSCRPGGMDLLPIPFTAIVEYSRIYEIVDFDDFFYIIRTLDNKFLSLHYDKKKGKDAKPNPDKNNSNKGRHARK